MGITEIAAVAAFIVSCCSVVAFWMRFSDRITKADLRAENAEKIAKEAAEKSHILATSFGLYREQIASQYVNREVMREVEDRLTLAINRLGDRLDKILTSAH